METASYTRGVRLISAVCGLFVGLLSTTSAAQESSVSASANTATSKRHEELFEVRARYGLAYRFGGQDVPQPGLSYDGVTFNDPGIQAWVWPLFDGLLGVTASFGREGFGLYDKTNNQKVISGGLLRANAAVTARFRLGPARLEPIVGYALAQIPDFGDPSAPVFRTGTRHGLLLAARGLVDLGPLTLEARFEYPLGLAATDGAGATATSSGLWAGGGVRWAFLRTGMALWGVMLDGAYSTDRLSNSAVQGAQSHVRGGVSLDVQWKEEDTVRSSGTLTVAVLKADGSPATGALLTVQTEGGPRPLALDADAKGSLADVAPGLVTARASLEGYEPGEGSVTISAGADSPLLITLKKQLPKVGSLRVTAIDKETKAALAGATVTVNGASITTDAKGAATFADLTPGVVNIEITLTGFTAKAEAATILAGVEATVSTELVSAKKRDPATVSGQVRNAKGGTPVTANLEIREANIKAKADAGGTFAFRLAGGTYTVTISAKGFVTQTKQVTVKDGDQAIFNVDLQPK